jgi:hypothetical protein
MILGAVASVGLVFISMTLRDANDTETGQKRNRIEAWFPFVFSQELDPRSITTVGDQVASEHLFAFHSRESIHKGFTSVISEVLFDEDEAVMSVNPQHLLKTSSGRVFGPKNMCSSFESSLRNASHSIFGSLVKKVECLSDSFRVHFTKIPVNIRYLLTLADFSIFDDQSVPISSGRLSDTTGPYLPVSVSSRQIELKLNAEYPATLRANEIPQVSLRAYSANHTSETIERMLTMKPAPLVYYYGYAVKSAELERLRSSSFRLREIPSEWIVYLALSRSINFKDRLVISSVLDRSRESLAQSSPLSQPAYSVSPEDRPYGITQAEYLQLNRGFNLPDGVLKLSKKYKIITLDEWSELPVFRETIQRLKAAFSGLEVQMIPRERIKDLWSSSNDITLSPMGIAPADPLNNFGFMTEFRHLISSEELASAALIRSPEAFNSKIKEFESRVIRDRIWIPIAHFSGLVAEPEDLERDESIAWSWGVQTWTYKVR